MKKDFIYYYRKIFGFTILGKPKKPTGSDEEKVIIMALMKLAKEKQDGTLASHMLDMAYEMKDVSPEFHMLIGDLYKNLRK